jgi:hypothetical protein
MAKVSPLCDDSRMDPSNAHQHRKRFHGWRLLGALMLVIGALAAVSFVVDWAVIGPLQGRVL